MSDTPQENGWEIFGKAVIGILYLGSSVALRATVISRLWMWFVVPLGVPSLVYAHAFGFGLFVKFICDSRKMPSKEERFAALVAMDVGVMLSTLGLGMLAHRVMTR